ncbi:MAG: hypothetical protein IAI48_00530 [Candidatus Eremiobacteraeota bacterium]|nr:hypothetical protein [Candidatus Eremiobacteraeota bacterium]
MKDVTNYGDHEWTWRVADWICERCGITRVSMNVLPVGGCSRVAAQRALPPAT